jgi:hypothetical protein
MTSSLFHPLLAVWVYLAFFIEQGKWQGYSQLDGSLDRALQYTTIEMAACFGICHHRYLAFLRTKKYVLRTDISALTTFLASGWIYNRGHNVSPPVLILPLSIR